MRPSRPGRSRLFRRIQRIPPPICTRTMRLSANPPHHHSPVLPRKIQRLKIPRLNPVYPRRRRRTCLPKPSLYPLKYPKIAGIRGFPRAVLASAIPSRPRAAGFRSRILRARTNRAGIKVIKIPRIPITMMNRRTIPRRIRVRRRVRALPPQFPLSL